MSQVEDDDSKPWTEHDLKEAIRRINAGEINFKEAENYYGISPRTIHRQRAIENMRAQLNPEKAKKLKSGAVSNAKKDLTILRKPVGMSCTSLGDVVSLLTEGSEEVKQLLNYECDLIYECKVCKSLFRSLLNFISHKRVYCCDMFSVAHIQTDENGDGAVAANSKVEEKLKVKENLKEFTSRPFRVTCRKDLTTVLKRISALSSEFVSADPFLHLQSMENTPFALQQIILPNPRVEEPTLASTVSNAVDKKPTAPEVESKKETSKPQEKTKSTSQPSETVAVKPRSVDSDKRSKCPLCPKHFSTKKSVLRHLKSIHHKSEEQVEKLKKRIQLFNVKKKSKLSTVLTVPKAVTLPSSSSAPPVNSPPVVPSSSSNENTSPIPASKSDQNVEKAHTRTSRKNTSNDGDTDAKIDSGADPKSSVVSSTPANVSGRAPKSEPNNALKKKPVPSTSQKKVAQPSSTSLPVSSSSKKIGIQVRIDYCKDGINQSAISAGLSPAGVPSPSGPPPTCSGDTRRSSITSVNRDEKSEGSKADLQQSHNTRSTSKSKLANILKSLRDKGEVRNKIEDPVIERIEWNAMSVYCEDCKTAYALNDQRWDAGSGSPRTFKCALQDCDFRSTIKNELLPHLSAQHTSLSENALAEMASIFIAEALGEGKFCCHRERSGEQPLGNRRSDTTGKSHAVSASTKRKMKRESNLKPSKRKVDISVKAEFAAVPIVPVRANDKTAATMWTSTNNNHQKVVLIPEEEKSKAGARKQAVMDGKRNVTPNVLQTSGDESTHFAPAKTLKNRNPLLGEMQVASTLPAVTVRLPSTPDPSDLDPATMSEENLKKSVMTIIFGKDVPDENVDANIVDNREKSPDSSSTSSDSGKEKRYGLRAVKPTKKGLVSSVPENKDDKMWKPFMNHQNKVKSASR